MASASSDLSARKGKTLDVRHRPVQPPLHTLACIPGDVIEQISKYLELNLITADDWVGPMHQFLDDCNKALEELAFFKVSQAALYNKLDKLRKTVVYAFCTVLSRRLISDKKIDRVKHWQKVVIVLSQPKWLDRFAEVHGDGGEILKVSFVTNKSYYYAELKRMCSSSRL
jgi:hypothetical protein